MAPQRRRVAIRTDSELHCPVLDAGVRELVDDYLLLPEGIDRRELAAAASSADLLLMCYTPIDRAVIEAAPHLRGIVKYGVGIDAIDIDAAMEHGVPVCNVPEYAEETVAEAAFALLLALARRLVPMDREMHANDWFWPQPQWLGSDIAEKTIGLIGVGKTGRSMARMAGAGFRARVLGYDPGLSPAQMTALGVHKCDSLATLLQASDFVSLHCVLNDDTQQLMGEAEFQAMKPGACLINVARGGLIDDRALLQALSSGRLGGAALDVYALEPLASHAHPLSELYQHPNVILTPHVAFYTHEAMQRLETETLARCREVLNGSPLLVRSADPRLLQQRSGVVFK